MSATDDAQRAASTRDCPHGILSARRLSDCAACMEPIVDAAIALWRARHAHKCAVFDALSDALLGAHFPTVPALPTHDGVDNSVTSPQETETAVVASGARCARCGGDCCGPELCVLLLGWTRTPNTEFESYHGPSGAVVFKVGRRWYTQRRSGSYATRNEAMSAVAKGDQK
jgi:hypothetical protein